MKPIYFSSLDTLRLVAFALVYYNHGFSTIVYKVTSIRTIAAGSTGVHLFFVISGFLITYLLFRELHRTGTISILNFYARRFLRIWPLYYLVMFTGIFVLPELGEVFAFNGSALLNLTFLNNFDLETVLNARHVGIAWSVAIEEQFYLFWPLVFFSFMRKTKLLIAVCVGIYLFATVFRIQYPEISYFHTFGSLPFLMVGCTGGVFFCGNEERFQDKIRSNQWLVILCAALTGLSVFVTIPWWTFSAPLVYLVIVVASVSLGRNDNRNVSIFSRLGKYTYGMYLYHPLIILFAKVLFDKAGLDYRNDIPMGLALGAAALTITIVMSILSYEMFEKRILKYKSKFSTVLTRV